MAWNFASSAKSTVQVGSGAQVLDQEIANFLSAGLDSARNKYANTPMEGMKYYRVKNVDKNNYSSQDVHGVGLAEVNSDLEDLPVDKQIVGFEQTITNYVLRKAMVIGREALETDRFGVIGDHSRNLIHSGHKTIERIAADSFNRGFGTTNLSILAEDGLGFFSANRPQPRATAGTWSNLASTGDLTADSVAAARVSFNTYQDGNGDLDPQMLDKVIVSPELADTMDEISNTSLKVDTSLNNTNVVSGTPYDVYHWLDAGTIIYCGDGENGLEFHIRKSPTTSTYNDGSNIDKIISRLYMALGTGLKRPGKFIGQQTT